MQNGIEFEGGTNHMGNMIEDTNNQSCNNMFLSGYFRANSMFDIFKVLNSINATDDSLSNNQPDQEMTTEEIEAWDSLSDEAIHLRE